MKGTETKKLDVRVQKTYDKLYKTFFELLASEPYDAITVLEICEKTGIHRATFYKHFVDKQDFVNFCVEKKLSNLDLTSKDSVYETGARSYYIDMCKKIVAFIYENRQLVADLNIKAPSSAFAQAIESAIAEYIEKRLTYLSAIGQLYINSPIHLLSYYYAGAIVSLLKAWSSDWNLYSKEDILNFIIQRYNEIDLSYQINNNKNQ